MSKRPTTEQLIVRAEKLADAGQQERALQTYLKLVEYSGSDPELWTRIGALYAQLGRPGEAAKAYERVAQLHAQQVTANKAPAPKDSAPPLVLASMSPSGIYSLPGPAKTKDAAALLLGEADSFLRLGLVDKAVEHLAAALRRDPLLRVLREPLVKLYVAQHQFDKALAELWALLTPCSNPQDEIRFLRYIIRLGDPDHAAEQRLKEVIGKSQLAAPSPPEEAAEPKLSVTAIGQELRQYLDGHRPPTDLAPTVVFTADESQRYMSAAQPPPSAATRPNAVEVAEAAEAIALSSGGLKAELKEVERCLRERRPAEALRRLQTLAARFPHSKTVQVQLQQLEQASAARPSPPEHSAASSAAASAAASPVAPGRSLLDRQTLEVKPDDIQEELADPAATPPPRPQPPPPPRRARLTGMPAQNEPPSDMARAFRTGVTMRSFGQHEQAIAMFDKARSDAKLCARAALMAGLCYRDLGRTKEAIASFMLGINTPEVSEDHLTELFYELARSHERLAKAGEAILFYRLSLGVTGNFRDSAERITALQTLLLKT